MVHGVKGGVPDEEAERPGAGHFALSVERANGLAVGVTVRVQSLVSQHRLLKRAKSEHLGPVLFRGERMTDDLVPIPPSSEFKSNWSPRGCNGKSLLGPGPSPTSWGLGADLAWERDPRRTANRP